MTKELARALDAISKPNFGRVVLAEQRIESGSWSKELVRAIAMDIGKAVVHHIETMYPKAIEACPSTFKLSVRNCVHNEIMAAVQVTDAGEISIRLHERKAHRRKIKAAYRKMRE